MLDYNLTNRENKNWYKNLWYLEQLSIKKEIGTKSLSLKNMFTMKTSHFFWYFELAFWYFVFFNLWYLLANIAFVLRFLLS